jgi:lysozyme|tara:strand:+ start:194 stop:652 length:459 start_codon:yes stop_codon:yes gene_type:complete
MERSKMQKLIDMLKRHEGEVKTNGRHVIYKCPAGFYTLGIGRNVDMNDGVGLSDDEVQYLLENDIERVIKELSSEYPWFNGLDDVRKDAIIDIGFNLGATKLRGFRRALTAMEEADYNAASDEFLDSKWARQVGSRSVELTEMIRTGKYLDD